MLMLNTYPHSNPNPNPMPNSNPCLTLNQKPDDNPHAKGLRALHDWLEGPLVRIWHVKSSQLVLDLDHAFAMTKSNAPVMGPLHQHSEKKVH